MTGSNSKKGIEAEDTSATAIAIPNSTEVKIEDDNDKSSKDEGLEQMALSKKEKSATDLMASQTNDGPTQGKSSSSATKNSKMNLDDHNGGDGDNDENDLIPFAHNMNTESMGLGTYPFSISHNLIC